MAGANALACVVVNPIAGLLTAWLGWRAAELAPAVVALLALLLSGRAASAPPASGAPLVRPLLVSTPVRRWIVAETTAYAAWTAFLTFNGAFFIERLRVPQAAVGWPLAAAAAGRSSRPG